MDQLFKKLVSSFTISLAMVRLVKGRSQIHNRLPLWWSLGQYYRLTNQAPYNNIIAVKFCMQPWNYSTYACILHLFTVIYCRDLFYLHRGFWWCQRQIAVEPEYKEPMWPWGRHNKQPSLPSLSSPSPLHSLSPPSFLSSLIFPSFMLPLHLSPSATLYLSLSPSTC